MTAHDLAEAFGGSAALLGGAAFFAALLTISMGGPRSKVERAAAPVAFALAVLAVLSGLAGIWFGAAA